MTDTPTPPSSDARARALAVAERLRAYIDWSGLYGTTPEPERYVKPLYPSKPLDERNTLVTLVAAALREARAEGLEEAINMGHDAAPFIGITFELEQRLRAQAQQLRGEQ